MKASKALNSITMAETDDGMKLYQKKLQLHSRRKTKNYENINIIITALF